MSRCVAAIVLVLGVGVALLGLAGAQGWRIWCDSGCIWIWDVPGWIALILGLLIIVVGARYGGQRRHSPCIAMTCVGRDAEVARRAGHFVGADAPRATWRRFDREWLKTLEK